MNRINQRMTTPVSHRLTRFCVSALLLMTVAFGTPPPQALAGQNHVPAADGEAVLEYPDGSRKAVARYKDGLLNGRYTAYAENGKTTVEARFRDGKLDGRFQRWADDGERLEIAGYVAGRLQGTRTLFVDGKPVRFEKYRKGELIDSRGEDSVELPPLTFLFHNIGEPGGAAEDQGGVAAPPKPGDLSIDTRRPAGYPLSLKELSAAMDKLASMKIDGAESEEHTLATRQTILHRLVSGVPKYMLKHDPNDAELARLGSKLCHKIGKLDHTPKNPGLPDDEYQKAYKGTSSSNLHQGSMTTVQAINSWMIDAGANNRDEVGHRRWMLSPGLYEVGYGKHEQYHALMVTNNYKPNAPYDLLTYPGRGYAPTSLYTSRHKDVLIWSIHPSSKTYTLPESRQGIKAAVTKLLDDGTREPVEVQRIHLTNRSLPVPALLIEPVIGKPEHDTRYEVEVHGLTPASKRIPATLKYIVHFVDMQKVK